ncbi:MAG: hypothetical protein VCB79_07380 [Dehalococcoidia bacterium]
MAFLLAAVLIVLSVGVVIYPFLKRRDSVTGDGPEDVASTTDRGMEAIVEDMRILRLDHQAGNIPDDLYQEQIRAYRLQAASHLRQQTEGQLEGADWELEQEVLMARLSLQAQDRDKSAEPVEPSTDIPEDTEQ